ncbi:hypothetical protein J2W32_001169 [Variovorax boronicumulans]|uniref:Uncharacterized protein n=1 Tax=Variovorax boronicumulans TaxID=436515 RepID=A0AAW8CQ07_9BURK|nr:hypothetical protein [Variovorax boronicumulans]MDQ0052133.1 hypothetical protein [Variovorax boronicumulans]
MNGVEVSPWPTLIVNVAICFAIVCWLVIDIRRELREVCR